MDDITWSETSDTALSWTGGGYYKKIFSIKIFGFMFVLWKKHGCWKEDSLYIDTDMELKIEKDKSKWIKGEGGG